MRISVCFYMILLLTVVIAGCGPVTFQVLDDSSSQSKKYAYSKKYAGIMNKSMYDYFVKVNRNSIIGDEKISKEKQKKLVGEIDDLQFEENRFLYFTMVYNKQYLDEELELKFELLDQNGKNLVSSDHLIYQKLYRNGVLESINYSYVIYCQDAVKRQISSGNAKLKVMFPDGSSRTYLAKL